MAQPSKTTSTKKTVDVRSIENLRVYILARRLEDQTCELISSLPAEQQFKLGNDLRRSSAGVCHYINDAHKRYSYGIKMEALHAARTEAEETNRLLERFTSEGFGETTELHEEYVAVIKQCWGLIKYLKTKHQARQQQEQAQATDALVAARS